VHINTVGSLRWGLSHVIVVGVSIASEVTLSHSQELSSLESFSKSSLHI
jgi:hypothetical protein